MSRRGLLADAFDKTARWSESPDQRGSIFTCLRELAGLVS